MIRRLPLAFVAIVFVLSACGGGVSAEDYFAEAEQAAAVYDQTTDEIFDLYRTIVGDALLDFQVQTDGAETDKLVEETAKLLEVTRTEVISAFEQSGEAMSEFITALEELDPPAEAEVAHDEALAALRRSRDAVPDLLNSFVTVQSLDDISAAINASTFGDTQPRVTAACIELQQVADDAGIEADLRCGADDG